MGERAEEALEPLRRELREDGFVLETCPGPESSACPVVSGRPCPAHGDPVAAVVIKTSGRLGRGRSAPSTPPSLGAVATSIARNCAAMALSTSAIRS